MDDVAVDLIPAQQSHSEPTTELKAEQASATVIDLEPASKAKAAQKSFDSLDTVLKALNEQDEQLKAMKGAISDMLANNAALKRGIKQIVQDAQKNDELENELQQTRKKLAMLKTFING